MLDPGLIGSELLRITAVKKGEYTWVSLNSLGDFVCVKAIKQLKKNCSSQGAMKRKRYFGLLFYQGMPCFIYNFIIYFIIYNAS